MQVFILRERREVNKHLQAHAVQNIGELKLFAAGFIIDDAYIGRTVFIFIQIHTVDDAADRDEPVFRWDAQRWVRCAVFELQLEMLRAEQAVHHFFRHVGDELHSRLLHAVQAVFFARRKSIIASHIFAHIVHDARVYARF